MSFPAIIQDIETRLHSSGVSVAKVCREAEIDRSLWHRWKNAGVEPRSATWEKVRAVLRPRIGEVASVPERRQPTSSEAA